MQYERKKWTKNISKIVLVAGYFGVFFFFGSCRSSHHKVDAYGIFEANEVIVSSEANGKLLSFNIEEGRSYECGEEVGCIDTVQIYLQIKQLEVSVKAALLRRPDIPTQVRTLQDKLSSLEKEYVMVRNLVEANAASSKQLNDINTEINITQSQIAAMKSNLNIQSRSILEEVESTRYQQMQLENMLSKCHIKSPMKGVVLKKYIEVNELAFSGKPLFKIADLTNMYIRVYVTEDMLSSLTLGQETEIYIDGSEGKREMMSGKISWISPRAEFTPKMIQTRDERVNLVYAVKVSFVNDNRAKIGMPGDVIFK